MSFEVELTDKFYDENRFAVELLSQPPIRVVALKQARQSGAQKLCPKCGIPAHYLKSLNRYYCFNCKSYVA